MTEGANPERQVRPISPDEVTGLQRELIPPEVIEIFNRFIGRTILNGHATIRQDDVVKALVESGLDKRAIFDNGWLNIEEIYREAGWEVVYDSPAYNESYPPTFKFTVPKKK